MDSPTHVRARYPKSGQYLVEGMPACASQISLRTMNFEQHWRGEFIEEINYQIQLPRAWFVECVSNSWDEYIEDARLDADKSKAEPSELDSVLIEHGFPPLEQALSNPSISPLIAEYFAHDTLLRWFGDGPPDEMPGYVLNTIDSTVLTASHLSLSGTGRMHRKGGSYLYPDI